MTRAFWISGKATEFPSGTYPKSFKQEIQATLISAFFFFMAVERLHTMGNCCDSELPSIHHHLHVFFVRSCKVSNCQPLQKFHKDLKGHKKREGLFPKVSILKALLQPVGSLEININIIIFFFQEERTNNSGKVQSNIHLFHQQHCLIFLFLWL